MKLINSIVLFLLLTVSVFGAEIRVATLNAFLLFDPAIEHRGKVDEQSPLSPANYSRKLDNLVALTKGYDVIGLQETGGKDEIKALAERGGYEWAFSRGKDTYTGQEVGMIFKMPGWKVEVNGRVGALDAIVSKHLLVTAKRDKDTVRFLVVHLIRPIGANETKHQRQLAAMSEWISTELKRDPDQTIAVIGDFNNTTIVRGGSVLGIGSEAGDLNSYSATHLANKPFDRMVVAGNGVWSEVAIVRPPYGNKPNDLNKSLWTDHFLLGATLSTR